MQPGSLVECIGIPGNYTEKGIADRAFCESHGCAFPERGAIYTVREIIVPNCIPCLLLEEIANPPVLTNSGIREIGFNIHGFREVLPPINVKELVESCFTLTELSPA